MPFLRAPVVLAAALLLGPAAPVVHAAPAAAPGTDAVVVAVIDSGFSPYHWDFLAAQMPQARTSTRTDDLPLHRPPHTWLRDFPAPEGFAHYAPLRLQLPTRDRRAAHAELFAEDRDAWLDVRRSQADSVHYRWIPDTKVIGAIAFGAVPDTPIYGTGPGAHGMGTASAAVGNIYGSCPECLLVFLHPGNDLDYETALAWALRQPWIDAVSNSYGMSTTPVVRDRVYAGSDTELQRRAVERGQSVFFSAGNGMMNDFVTPNGTLLSSQEGPDWIVTVGATEPADVDFPGSGKPADVAAIGSQYPSSYGSTTVTGSGTFSGTSNSTPVVAGIYGRALWLARRALSGPSRVQERGVIARGGRMRCGAARRACELGDGVLTRRELQQRLFEGAKPTTGGFAGRRTVPRSLLGVVPIPEPVGGHPVPFVTTPPVADTRRLSEGYGTYRARFDGDAKWRQEFDTRLWDVLTGARAAPPRPPEDVDWFRVDSWCRQHIWGGWREGAYVDEATTPLPFLDPIVAPTRTALQVGCRALTRPPS